jgi:FKBP12-rapamycin complex-associated protein
LAQASGTLTAELVQQEVKRALDWLQGKHESRRYAAVLVLKELAINSPTRFYVHVSSFFDLVWYPASCRVSCVVCRVSCVSCRVSCVSCVLC